MFRNSQTKGPLNIQNSTECISKSKVKTKNPRNDREKNPQ